MFSEMLEKKRLILPAMFLLWMKEIASTTPKAATMEVPIIILELFLLLTDSSRLKLIKENRNG